MSRTTRPWASVGTASDRSGAIWNGVLHRLKMRCVVSARRAKGLGSLEPCKGEGRQGEGDVPAGSSFFSIALSLQSTTSSSGTPSMTWIGSPPTPNCPYPAAPAATAHAGASSFHRLSALPLPPPLTTLVEFGVALVLAADDEAVALVAKLDSAVKGCANER